MGCWYSRAEREEMVTRCRARKRYMKQFVKARQNFSASHSMYFRSLKNTGNSLLNFATAEITHHHTPTHYQKSSHVPEKFGNVPERYANVPEKYGNVPERYGNVPEKYGNAPEIYGNAPEKYGNVPEKYGNVPEKYSNVRGKQVNGSVLYSPVMGKPVHGPSRFQEPVSPTSISWTTSTTPSTCKTPLPPPPPPPESEGSVWGFWDPFVPGSETEEEWEGGTGTGTGKGKEDGSGGGSELAMVVSSKSKDLVEIIMELDEYFLKAAQAGAHVSCFLEVWRSSAKVYGEGKSLSPLMLSFGSCQKLDGFGNCSIGNNYSSYEDSGITGSHHSTVERLYAWEKKLYQEVKKAHILKINHEKRTAQLRKLEIKRTEYMKTEKTKKEVEKLESRLMVATQAIETISAEIIKIRESELYPQLVELVKGLMAMWRSLYEFHQVQTHIVKQLKYIRTIASMNPTSEIHRQSTLQLELEVQQWHLSFCHLIKSQREYIQFLSGWLRLSLFQFTPLSKTPQDSLIYTLCEEWHLSMDRIPDKVASEGINTFLTVIHAIVIQQEEEQKQKKRSETASKEMEKKAAQLRSLESKYGPYSMPGNSVKNNPIVVKRAKFEALKTKAEEEKTKHEKAVSVTRAITMNNLQMGLPHVFDAVTGFANVCIHAYETVHNKAKSVDEFHDVKRLLP